MTDFKLNNHPDITIHQSDSDYNINADIHDGTVIIVITKMNAGDRDGKWIGFAPEEAVEWAEELIAKVRAVYPKLEFQDR